VTKKELQQYKTIAKELDCLQIQLRRLQARLMTPRSSVWSLTPRGGSPSDWTDIYIAYDKLETHYKERISHALTLRLQIETAIDAIPDADGRSLMRYRYIDGLTWEMICVKLSYSYRQIHRLHGETLKKMAHYGTL